MSFLKTHPLAAGIAGVMLFNDGSTIEELQERLLKYTERANTIQAKADAEKRELTDDEAKEVSEIFAAFEGVQADIARREQLAAINATVRAPAPRKTDTDDVPVQNRQTGTVTKPANRAPSIEAVDDTKRWGFKSFGEFARSVMAGSRNGGNIDPRLIANAPTTFGQEGTGADGGFAVPPEFRQQIMKKVLGEDSLLVRTDQQTSSSNSLTIPKDETTPWQTSGGIQAYWEGEASQLAQSKPSLQNVTVKLNKLTSLIPVTDELLEDQAALTNFLNSKAPDKMDFKVTDAILRGTGAGQPLGILNSPALVTVAAESGQATATINYQNVVKMWGRAYNRCRRNAVWLINQDAETQLQQMVLESGNATTSLGFPAYLPPGGLSGSPYGMLMGRPVITTEACSALGTSGDIILADLSTYLSIVKAGGIRQDVSIHLWFDYDVTAFRFIMRVGGQPWWSSPITRAHGSNTLSCFVALADRP